MPIIAGGYDSSSHYRGQGTVETPSSMSTTGKVAFSLVVVTAALITVLIVYCYNIRKQRAVAPAPSVPDDVEEGRREHDAPEAPVVIPR